MLTVGHLKELLANVPDSTTVIVRLPATTFDGGHGYVPPTKAITDAWFVQTLGCVELKTY